MTMVASGTVRRKATASLTLANRLLKDNNYSAPMYGRVTENRQAHGIRTDSVLDEDMCLVRLGGNQSSDDRSEEELDGVISEEYRFNGTFFYCRRCGQSYVDRLDVLRHCAHCNVHEKSCHVVARACQIVNRLI